MEIDLPQKRVTPVGHGAGPLKTSMRSHKSNTFTRCLGVLLAIHITAVSLARGQYVSQSGAGITRFAPAQKPTAVGPVNVGVILVLFPDTQLKGGIPQFKTDLDHINGLTQEDYFKIYSNDITWPVARLYPGEDEKSIYHAPQCYGYYCKFDFWGNPIGWKSKEEGQKRASILRADALRAAKSTVPSANYKTLAYCYITTVPHDPSQRADLRRYYAAVCGQKPEEYPDPTKPETWHPKKDPPKLFSGDKPFEPWDFYHPGVAWGEPMWPNSIIQFNSASASTFAHEFGHVLGAPDIYRVGRPNDGISGTPVLMSYGPTATAFSRFYHHGFVQEKNYPTITAAGTYTLYPRHIKPENNEALGYIIPSRHPHYYYHIEYIYGENPALGAGGGEEVRTDDGYRQSGWAAEGVLISVINLGESNYLGSPDGFYTYRPNDPWFRGLGDTGECLFGDSHNRTDFNFKTEPSARLPDLLDGGVSFKNITEHQGTATFEVELDKSPLTQPVYQNSLIPQIKLEPVDQLLPTSFRMTGTIKFRGEPLIDQYGFCWNTSPGPQVRYEHFTLSNCNYDMMQGRALNLKPNTQYYVRAWASNARGIRYSDEELIVKTPALTAEINAVGPLLLDSFSNNTMLHDRFSNNSLDENGHKTTAYEAYAPVAVLAKLAAYYHPDGLLAPHANVAPNPARGDTLGPGHELMADEDPKAGKSKSLVNFGRLHWDPRESDPVWRTVETIALCEEMRTTARACKMYDLSLSKDFLTGFNKAFRHKLEPDFAPITSQNLDTILKQIKTELINGRPVIIIESPQPNTSSNLRLQWGLIDGYQDGDKLHIDFPQDTDWVKEKNERLRYTTLDTLIVKDYDSAILMHISF
jgi:hypothetical protein